MSYAVAGDWGTSNLRLYRIEKGVVVERATGPGIGNLGAPPEQVLRATLAPWRETGEPSAIRLCGMVGSRNGWVEIPYADCPADAAAWRRGAVHLALDAIPVTIGAGLACTRASGAADVMRGEETQIFGAMAIAPALAHGRHLVALPGTHSKWAQVEDGRVTGFQTFLTGELFALLRDHSTLTRASAEDGADTDEATGFATGLARIDAGGHLLGALFEARAAQLRSGVGGAWARGFLSGLVIGAEIAEIAPAATGEIALIGDPALVERYSQALAARSLTATAYTGDACSLAGLALLETP
ncbi:2-dehydro-3-deoxygalactonokinase [Sphingomonas hengshuiensis]|uniref:2-dehydro-3-deoxygalactonokinase n=1 Tax=Sphingomonas hengshuiensis TaxID=1609977 RepID=A0A7U4J925_9SPHN|nr:2-dehydro-3-deoxygalactonokinase [Sphingomonas hengshuiensis]AJP72495.1 2-dehydro-3-deoxygalactonokinase [Sphingomonas hengshuiensis]